MILSKAKRLAQRPFVRNVATLASGTAASQAIAMAFAPIITRLYGPEAFGLHGVFMSAVGLLTTIAALGYPTAMVLPRSDKDALTIGRLSVYIGLTITALVTLLLALYGEETLSLLNASEIAPFVFLMPVAMIISVLAAVISQWLVRKQAFSITATYGVITSFLVNSTKVVAGFINPSALLLIATNTVGGLLGTVLTYWGWRHVANNRPDDGVNSETSTHTVLQLARMHYDFPIMRTPQNLINAFSQSLPVLLLASYFGASSAGQYAIAISVLGIPSTLIGGSVMSVFYPKITQAINNGEDARSMIIKTTTGMAVMGALPFLVVLIAGPFLFEIIFGNEWHTAGVYAQLLSVWLFLQFINKPAVSAIPALKIQGGLLMYELFSTGTKVLALWMGFAFFRSDIVAISIFSLFGIIAYTWLIYWVIQKSSLIHQSEVLNTTNK